MKIQVTKEKLLSGLDLCCKVAGKNKALMILDNIHISVEDSVIKLEASNADTSVTRTIEALSSDDTWEALVDAVSIQRYVKLIGSDTITLEHTGKKLRIKHDKGRFDLPLADLSQWHKSLFNHGEEETQAEIPSRIINDIAGKAAAFVGNDSFRPQFMNVHLVCNEDSIYFDATDTIVLIRVDDTSKQAGNADLLIPTFVLPLISVCDDTARLFISEHYAKWEIGATSVCHTKPKGVFPDTNRVIPKNYTNDIKCDRLELLSAVRRVASSSGAASAVKLNFEDNTCKMSMHDADTDKYYEETVSCDYKAPTKVCLNAEKFIKCLCAFDGDKITLSIMDSSHTVKLTDESNPRQIVIIQPMNYE